MQVATLTALFAASASLASEIVLTGTPRVGDGDTLALGETVIRLHGIDAFESGQDCEREGRRYPCGAACGATNRMRVLSP